MSGCGSGSGGAALCSSATGAFSSASFFLAFFRIFTRSTMRVLRRHAVFARGGVDAGGIDRRRVFAEGVEERGRGEGVDQARDAAAQRVNLHHRFAAERIARAAGDADAMLDVFERLVLR